MAGLGSIIKTGGMAGKATMKGGGHAGAAKAVRGMYGIGGAAKKPTGGRVAARAQAARRKASVKRRRTR